MRIKKLTCFSLMVLFTCCVIAVLIWFSPALINLQSMLYRARWLLLIWRIMIYCIIGVLIYVITTRTHFKIQNVVYWPAAFLVICEISNLLQWGAK